MSDIVLGSQDTREGNILAEWCRRQISDCEGFGPWFTTIGFRKEGVIQAVVVYNNYRAPNIEASIACVDPKWTTRTNLGVAFSYPFTQLGCSRVTAIVDKKNRRARKFLAGKDGGHGIGFKLEGVLRQASPNGEDMMIYGLTRDECKWTEHG